MPNPSHRSPPHAALYTRRRWLGAAAGVSLVTLAGCGGGEPTVAAPSSPPTRARTAAAAGAAADAAPAAPVAPGTRTWHMGFSRVPPAATLASMLECLNLIRGRAEFVVMAEHLPWAELLAGASPTELVERELAPVADYIRNLGLQVVLLLELTDGTARGQEAPGLLALGRSLTEPEVQQAYAAYARAANRRIRPAGLGLATETNAVRLLAPPALYQAVVQAAGAAAQAVRADDPARRLLVSVQVEVAWGLMPGQQTGFEGLARDLADFGFVQAVGLSSYPFFPFSRPEAMPVDYYSRLLPPGSPPALVVEGGWPSIGQPGVTTSREMQARYLAKQAALLDSIQALGVAQLMLADLDLSQWAPDVAAALSMFSSLGVLDSGFQPKPAAAAWDQLFARRLRA